MDKSGGSRGSKHSQTRKPNLQTRIDAYDLNRKIRDSTKSINTMKTSNKSKPPNKSGNTMKSSKRSKNSRKSKGKKVDFDQDFNDLDLDLDDDGFDEFESKSFEYFS